MKIDRVFLLLHFMIELGHDFVHLLICSFLHLYVTHTQRSFISLQRSYILVEIHQSMLWRLNEYVVCTFIIDYHVGTWPFYTLQCGISHFLYLELLCVPLLTICCGWATKLWLIMRTNKSSMYILLLLYFMLRRSVGVCIKIIKTHCGNKISK